MLEVRLVDSIGFVSDMPRLERRVCRVLLCLRPCLHNVGVSMLSIIEYVKVRVKLVRHPESRRDAPLASLAYPPRFSPRLFHSVSVRQRVGQVGGRPVPRQLDTRIAARGEYPGEPRPPAAPAVTKPTATAARAKTTSLGVYCKSRSGSRTAATFVIAVTCGASEFPRPRNDKQGRPFADRFAGTAAS